jgi:hypothetical protein
VLAPPSPPSARVLSMLRQARNFQTVLRSFSLLFKVKAAAERTAVAADAEAIER